MKVIVLSQLLNIPESLINSVLVLGTGTPGRMSPGVSGSQPALVTSLKPFPTSSCTTWSAWASTSAPAPLSGSSRASLTTPTSVSLRFLSFPGWETEDLDCWVYATYQFFPALHSLQPSVSLGFPQRWAPAGEGAVPLRRQQEVLAGAVLPDLWADRPLDHRDGVQHHQWLRLPGLHAFPPPCTDF